MWSVCNETCGTGSEKLDNNLDFSLSFSSSDIALKMKHMNYVELEVWSEFSVICFIDFFSMLTLVLFFSSNVPLHFYSKVLLTILHLHQYYGY